MEFEMNLEQTLNEITGKLYGKNIGACTDAQLYTGVLQLTKEKMAETPAITGDKKVYYISMEFLIGKLLSNNLINLGIGVERYPEEERQESGRHRRGRTRTFSG